MNYTQLVRPEVLTQPVYEAGRPIEDVARDFGLDPNDIVKLASNENPLGPSPLAIEAVRAALDEAHLYPDGGCYALRQKLAKVRGVEPNELIIGNGSNEILVLLCQLFLRPGDEAVMGAQSFIAMKLSCMMTGATPVEVPMPNLSHDLDALAAAVTERTRVVYLPCPSNPTGDSHSQAAIEALVKKLPENVVFLYDEAYAEYVDTPVDLLPLIRAGHKVVCMRTFSKIYGLAAFRIGYAYGDAELMGLLGRIRQPFNVNALAQIAATAALDDHMHVAKSRAMNSAGQAHLACIFQKLGLEYVPTEANFVLLRVENSRRVFELLQSMGVIIRPLNAYNLPNHVRISVGTEAENNRLGSCLETILGGPEASILLPSVTADPS